MSENKVRKAKQVHWKEHALKRGMWAGDKKNQNIDYYILSDVDKEQKEFTLQSIKFSPVLYKIIDEIIVNATDHAIIYPNLVKHLEINVSDEGEISIKNDGPGIPIIEIENLSGKKMYQPQLIFTEFLSGSNLDDDEDNERIVGGQNGIGAKLTVVFSKKFTIETYDEKTSLHYTQNYLNNLDIIEEPIIKKEKKKPFTKITFMPDYEKFKINPTKEFIKVLISVVETRAWFAAAYSELNVKFNSENITVKKFIDFCSMFSKYLMNVYQMTDNTKKNNKTWEVCIGVTEGKEVSISCINGIVVLEGGNHIKHIQNEIVSNLKENVEKILKPAKVKFNKNLLLNNVFIFVKGVIENVSFKSQTKDIVSNEISQFENYKFPENAWSSIWKLLEPSISATFLKKQLGQQTTRANRSKILADKYEEAEFARDPKRCHECGLIITEGDSANGTAEAGLSDKEINANFNRQYYGTFIIKGVAVNALKESLDMVKVKKTKESSSISKDKKPKKSSTKKLSKESSDESDDSDDDSTETAETTETNNDFKDMELKEIYKLIPDKLGKKIPKSKLIKNERIDTLKRVLGLDYNKSYDFTAEGEKEYKTLRYGFIVGLMDQDLDGFNIFGLIITYFTTYWPNLVKRGFIRRINTPIIRAYPKLKNSSLEVLEFYTQKEASDWVDNNNQLIDKYKFKYYKGLGSHVPAFGEVRQLFTNIEDKICTYVLDDNAIKNMQIYYGSFTKPRKLLLSIPAEEKAEINTSELISNHFNIDTKLYQRDNIIRKLLCMVDGFVSSRRKVYYSIAQLSRDEIKVSSFVGEAMSKSNYHHGEASLGQTIIRMAQAQKYARNLPLLIPLGNFGSLKKGFNDSAAVRYIYTKRNYQLSDKLFRQEDNFILEYELEDGIRYEPKYYVPIIPYVLTETNEIPATGWVINLHARKIEDIFSNLRDMINGKIEKCGKLRMWNKDFKGSVRIYNKRGWFVGNYEHDEKANEILITELPTGKYSDTYIKGPDESTNKKSKRTEVKGIIGKEYVEDIVDNTNENGVEIIIKLKPDSFEHISKNYGNEKFDCIEEYFELKTPIYDRLNLVNERGEVVEYKTYEEIFDDWYKFRKSLYKIRIEREFILNDLEIIMLENMQKFSSNHASFNINKNTKDEEVIKILTDHKFRLFNHTLLRNPKYTAINELKELITEKKHGANYDYLLNMSYKDLTEEAYNKRAKDIDNIKLRQNYLIDDNGMFPGAKIWLKELEELEEAIKEGIKTDWMYGTNNFKFANNSKKKTAKKRVVKKAK